MVGATILICIIAVWILSPPIAVGHTVIGIITYIVVKIGDVAKVQRWTISTFPFFYNF